MKLLIGSLVGLVLLSCGNNTSNTQVFWVSGFKTTCDNGAGKSNCLMISKDEDVNSANWELFYSGINGFEFEEGVLKRIEVKVSQKEQAVPADTSNKKYVLIKEIASSPDSRIKVGGDWVLEAIGPDMVATDSIVQTLSFDLAEMRISGHGGCNVFNASIQSMGVSSVEFGQMLNTLRMCEHQSSEDTYLSLLQACTKFKLDNERLVLYGEDESQRLEFSKMRKTDNKTRIHDIWTAVRIDGNPLNRMVTVPRLEVNTSEMKIFGNDGCNDYFGTINKLTEGEITLNGIGSTRKMCQDMEVPQRYNEALSKIKNYKFETRLLIFSDESGNEVLAFLKTD